MKLLLHICCGPCASATIPAWRQKGAEVLGFFYNPNIHPLLEYRRRLTGARDVAEITEVSAGRGRRVRPGAVVRGSERRRGAAVRRCIAQRLERAAAEAVVQGCDAFSTTLSISPWQDHEAIRAGGERAARLHGVEFVYEDLRPLYPESRRLSRDWGIYRQKYCGCLISEWERYRAS